MIFDILSWLSGFIVNFISTSGYLGVTILMLLESACFPIPSEIIMPFSGYLVFTGRFIFLEVVFWGTIGNLLGSMLAYAIGFYGGRPFIEKYGRYIFISRNELETADKWFYRYGQSAVFFSRLLPVIRTFISLPAGIARMDFKKFCFYTFIGSFPWVFILTYSGVLFGENWRELEIYFKKIDWVIGVSIVLLAGFWIYKKNKKII